MSHNRLRLSHGEFTIALSVLGILYVLIDGLWLQPVALAHLLKDVVFLIFFFCVFGLVIQLITSMPAEAKQPLKGEGESESS